jgi:hypothetical protein
MLNFNTVDAFLKLSDHNNPNAGSSFDDFPEIKIMVNELQYAFEEFCYRKIATVDLIKETFYITNGDSFLALDALPIKKVNEVKIDGKILSPSVIKTSGGGIYIPKNNTNQDQRVDVKYFGGFEEMPPAILRAARIQMIYEYERRNYLGAQSVSSEGTTVSYPEFGLLKEVKRLLQNYKNYNKAPI